MEESAMLPYGIAFCYLREDKLAEAEKWLGRYLEYPGVRFRRNALLVRGDSYFRQADYTRALADYVAVGEEFPGADGLYPYYQAGLCCALTGDAQGRVKNLSKVLEADAAAPYYSDALFELGRAYVETGDPAAAQRCFDGVLAAGRDSTCMARSLIELAMLARNRGDVETALGYYKAVVEQLPLSTLTDDALLAVESIYQSAGRPKEYLDYLDRIGRGQSKSAGDREQMLFSSAEQACLSGNHGKGLSEMQDFVSAFPESALRYRAYFYIAEAYRAMGDKERACDYYSQVAQYGEGSFVEVAMHAFADLSFELENWDDAYGAYRALESAALLENNRQAAVTGVMRAAWRSARYDDAVEYAGKILSSEQVRDAALRREACYLTGKSLLATSRREEAMRQFSSLTEHPDNPEGGEAYYLLVCDAFARADYSAVESLTYAFSDAHTHQMYYLARCFAVLGDSFVERGDRQQARATYESILSGYKPVSDGDDVLETVREKLGKISQ